jgi:hypothetical protein
MSGDRGRKLSLSQRAIAARRRQVRLLYSNAPAAPMPPIRTIEATERDASYAALDEALRAVNGFSDYPASPTASPLGRAPAGSGQRLGRYPAGGKAEGLQLPARHCRAGLAALIILD